MDSCFHKITVWNGQHLTQKERLKGDGRLGGEVSEGRGDGKPIRKTGDVGRQRQIGDRVCPTPACSNRPFLSRSFSFPTS